MSSSQDHPDKTPSVNVIPVPQSILEQAAEAAEAAEEAEEGDEGGESGRTRTRASEHLPQYEQVEGHDHGDDIPPPAYNGSHYGDICSTGAGMEGTKASLNADGRIDICINQTSRRLSTLLAPALRQQLDLADHSEVPPPYIPPSLGGEPGQLPPPPLNVVIHVVGSRGDVQPFVALGKVLKDRYGHRVRLATHPTFKDFVTENGLEFFSIGGDPAALMAFMVKNPGLMPGFDTMRSGDVGKRRQEISTMVKGCWRSCIEAGNGMGPEVSDDTQEDWMNADQNNADVSMGDIHPADKPFVADAIIANPPSFAHIHCAEKLGCPLHIMFTMPYSPTQAFPHPLANIQASNTDPNLANFLSYALVEMMTWQGLGDIINRFRQKSLNLEPISLMWAPGMLARLRIPHTYCWSPALIPKPKDWGNHITLAGFYFLSLASNYSPDPDLKAFLDAGPPPVYIGFGSIVLEDPNAMTKLIFDAVRKTGQRALVSKGWGGVGADQLGIPDSVYMLGNVPHDWLFQHVSCVVHHGGAGTTAAGITAGKPTVIVPFFGDQPFWGAMVAKAGAGPDPIPHKELTADVLAEAINTALKPETLERAHELASQIAHEKGTEDGAQFFHQFVDLDKMRCMLEPTRAAVWRVKRTDVRLSALAATVLSNEGLLSFKDLKLYRSREYDSDEGPPDPISGGAGAIIGTMSSMMMGFADMPVAALKVIKVHPDSRRKTEQENDDPKPESSTGPRRSESGVQSQAISGASTPRESSVSTRSTQPTSFNLSESLAKISKSSTPSVVTSQEGAAPEKYRHRTPSMAQALREQITRSRSRSNSRSNTPPRSRASSSAAQHGTRDSAKDADGSRDIMATLDDVLHTGKGVSRIVGAGFKSPMDFTQGLAKGFHNAPKLYGDESVRKADRVTDFRSGLMAAGKEFGYGFYDGITGLVTQPINGARKEGAAGFIKGFGKGIGGVVFKPGAAIFGLPAYTMKGIYKELQLSMGSSVQNYIIAARTAQGYDDWQSSSQDEREDIVRRWYVLQRDMKKKRNPHEHLQDLVAEQRSKVRQWDEERKRPKSSSTYDAPGDGKNTRTGTSTSRSRAGSGGAMSLLNRIRESLDYQSGQRNPRSAGSSGSGIRHSLTETPSLGPLSPAIATTDKISSSTLDPLHHARTAPTTSTDPLMEHELNEAIIASVLESSRGNPEEDALVARAIHTSVAELSSRPPNHNASAEDEEEELRKALEASMAEAEHFAHEQHDAGDVDDDELARALEASLQGVQTQIQGGHGDWAEKHKGRRVRSSDSEWDSSDEEQGDRYVDNSTRTNISSARNDINASHDDEVNEGEEEELKRALESSRSHAETEKKRQDEEERVVLEYVKKQSLMEEENRKRMAASKGKKEGTTETGSNGGNANDVNIEDDEDLKKAMELSLAQGRGGRHGQEGGSSSSFR